MVLDMRKEREWIGGIAHRLSQFSIFMSSSGATFCWSEGISGSFFAAKSFQHVTVHQYDVGHAPRFFGFSISVNFSRILESEIDSGKMD
jgi:hypothetical protein